RHRIAAAFQSALPQKMQTRAVRCRRLPLIRRVHIPSSSPSRAHNNSPARLRHLSAERRPVLYSSPRSGFAQGFDWPRFLIPLPNRFAPSLGVDQVPLDGVLPPPDRRATHLAAAYSFRRRCLAPIEPHTAPALFPPPCDNARLLGCLRSTPAALAPVTLAHKHCVAAPAMSA